MGEWVSVKERLPREAGYYFTAFVSNGKPDVDVEWFKNTGHGDWSSVHDITHWMPLPDPPEPELKPCPFCGSDEVIVGGHFHFYVRCTMCGAGTKICRTKDAAVVSWNRRAGDYR